MANYRFVEVESKDGNETVKWQGSDVSELNQEYQLGELGHSRFEIEIVEGIWIPCGDPRTPLSTSELEIVCPDDYDDSEEDWEGWDEPSGVWPTNDNFSTDHDGYPE